VREYKIDANSLLSAKSRSETLGVLNSSMLKGGGNLVGFIGEYYAHKYLGGELIDNFDYDLFSQGLKIDVKTKSCSSIPLQEYLCSVMCYQLNNDCDSYFFCRVNLSAKICWLLGSISKDRLIRDGILMKEGDRDGNFIVKADCISIPISGLNE